MVVSLSVWPCYKLATIKKKMDGCMERYSDGT